MPKSCKCILDRMVFKGAMTEEERDKIMRNLKGTEWHPYPQEKPKSNQEYNITLKDHTCATTATYFTEDDTWYAGDVLLWPRNCITAWTELPERYEEGEDEPQKEEKTEHDTVIVVQIDCLMPMENVLAFRKNLLDQTKDGIIVIPPWAHIAHVGDECEIEIKEMEEQNNE